MRDILFRGKNIYDGSWEQGAVAQVYYPKERVFIVMCRPYGDEFQFMDYVRAEVYPITIGQYTGLCDENGIGIYEGDIVSTDLAGPYLIVEFRNGAFMFKCNDGGESYYDMMLPLEVDDNTIIYGEVIGNIHDNPELLEGEMKWH